MAIIIESKVFNGKSRNLSMTFDLSRSGSGQLVNLRKWLVQALNVDNARIKNSFSNDQKSFQKNYLSCLFFLSEILFQQSGVPVFSHPQVKSISKIDIKKNEFRATIEFHEIEYLPRDLYLHIYNMSFRLCSWMAQTELTEVNRKQLYSMIQNKIIDSLKGSSHSGKSTVPILRAAHEANVPFRHIGLGVYALGWGSKAKRLDRSIIDCDSAIGARLSRNKLATAQVLRSAGLPAPKHSLVGAKAEAVSAASSIGYPIVVKPNDLDRGEGVTVDICNDEQLEAAFEYAQLGVSSKLVLVEKQAPGVCHRIFIADGRMLYAVKRNAMSVVGDGANSVEKLVAAELSKQGQMPVWLRSGLMPIDDLAKVAINGAGHTLESIPKKDELVPLRRIESTEWGGVDQDVTDIIHPENLKIAIEAARLIGLRVAGVDLICEDITIPWYETEAIINEVNLAPLLGCAEISRRYLPEFLHRLIEGDGRIPIEAAKSKAEALLKQAEFTAQGLRCYVTGSDETLDYQKCLVPLALDTLDKRVGAVLARADADALVVYSD